MRLSLALAARRNACPQIGIASMSDHRAERSMAAGRTVSRSIGEMPMVVRP